MTNAIEARGVGKQYRLYPKGRPNTIQEAVIKGLRGLKATQTVWALRDVDFTIPKGSMVGVLGHNGAGKSTLLRLLAGVLKPDAGKITMNGRVGGLLELGAGFHPDLTGSENIYVNGVISGLTRDEVAARYDDIVAFAELEKAINFPLRTYSSGMQMRLGFAISAFTDPEILLIDEVLAVGDVAFQRKCFERIAQFRREGRTIVYVTHSTDQVRELCDQAIWLHHGRLMQCGAVDAVVDGYLEAIFHEQQTAVDTTAQADATPTDHAVVEGAFHIGRVRLLDEQQQVVERITSGNPVQLEINFRALANIAAPIFAVNIYNDQNQLCCHLNTAAAGLLWPSLSGAGQIAVQVASLPLIGGTYWLDIEVYSQDWMTLHARHRQVKFFDIMADEQFEHGVLLPEHQWLLNVVREWQAD